MRVAVCVFILFLGSAGAAELSRAAELMRNKQYNDAIKILNEEVKGKSGADAARPRLMLGECLYLIGKNEEAKPHFTDALKFLTDEKDKAAAAFRLPIIAYKLKDYSTALEGIESFGRQFPGDARHGKLLVYKMSILSAKGKPAQEEIEAAHRSIQSAIKQYGYATGMEADGILTDYYGANGLADKAQALLAQTVHNFRNVIAEYQRDKQPLPAGLEKYHDTAALQLGILCTERKDYPAAAQWLENVRYDPETKMKARLLLAKAAYEQQDFKRAMAALDPAFLDTVPEGPLKSDMHLILGICEKNRPNYNAAKVEEYLKKVAPESRGYPQAQLALADAYREKGLTAEAIKAYTRVMERSEYAASALYNLGVIYQDEAARAATPDAGAPSLKLAAASFSQLLAKYPLSPETKKARERVDELNKKGVAVNSGAGGAEDSVAAWRKTAEKQRGSPEAAQALLSLARHHAKTLVDEKTKQVLQAPNFAEGASACDALLDEKFYTGKGLTPEAWKALRAEANYQRGMCELASISPPKESSGNAAPVFLQHAAAQRAVELFQAAKRDADPKQLDLIRGIEIGLLEALFKSSAKENKEAAERRFVELEAELGNDPRFQRLTLELAEWYRSNGRYAEAAKAYASLAERGRELSEEDTLKTLYQAGSLYSKAGLEAQNKKGETAYGIYIYPKETLNLGASGVLKSYEPLQREFKAVWPRPTLTVREALTALSKQTGVPFVWSREYSKEFAHALDNKRVTPSSGPTTGAKILEQILDLTRVRLDFDMGFTGGTPTLDLAAKADDPATQGMKTIEIFDERAANQRFAPLARNYGNWQQVHERPRKGAGGVMLHAVLARVEEISGTKMLWAEGVEKDAKLAAEFRDPPNVGGDHSSARILAAVLDAQGLAYRITPRDLAAEHYEKAKDCFNQIRKLNPKSKYGERSLFALALNYFNQKDFNKMKIVLREYLKIFDNPGNEYYHPACYYLGWLFEREKNSREACGYYARAAEEQLVLYKRAPDEPPLDKERLKHALAYDVIFPLSEPLHGELKDKRLADVADFIRLNTRVDVRLDTSVQALDSMILKPAFKNESAFDLMIELLNPLGVGARGENVNKETAEKAYYRMAVVYERENQMEQALENVRALLERFPQTAHKRDASVLKLGIYKGLKNYTQVLTTLEELKQIGGKDVEAYRFQAEAASIYFDLCDYAKAAAAYCNVLGVAKDPAERAEYTERLARALFRDGKIAEAQEQYAALEKLDTAPLGKQIAKLMDFYFAFAQGKAQAHELPEEFKRFMFKYEQLDDAARKALSQNDLALVTWIYYAQGLMHQKRGAPDVAVVSFTAAANSPDDALAGEAGYQSGMMYFALNNHDKAKEAFEYVLFSTRSAEAAVKSTYMLGVCFDKLNKPDKALERFQQIVERYPVSPYAELARKTEVFQASVRKEAVGKSQK